LRYLGLYGLECFKSYAGTLIFQTRKPIGLRFSDLELVELLLIRGRSDATV
jgi:hypothetical protein